VASRKLAGEVLQVVILGGLQEPGNDAKGERVAADTGEVFAQQVNCPPGIASGRGADHFDVVAFPGHRPPTGVIAWGAGDGAQIGGGQPEARVGADREAQCRGGLARVGGSLRLLVPRGRSPGCGDGTAVDLNCGPGSGQVIMVAGVFSWLRLHDYQAARKA